MGPRDERGLSKSGPGGRQALGGRLRQVNECVLEFDYPDIATYDRELTKFQSTAETMAAFRRGVEVRAPEHWPWDELQVETPTLA